MKLQTVLVKINRVFSYLKRRRISKLYQQWVEQAELPINAIPQEETSEVIVPRIDKEPFQQPLLYMILGAALVILFVGIILFILYSC
ncbi:hypothetical protein ACFLTP_01490 [Chloroflexota bacterium]